MLSRFSSILLVLLVSIVLTGGCVPHENPATPSTGAKEPPAQIPEGVLVKEVPTGADIIFTSKRYVLGDIACLDTNYEPKRNFINDPECNRVIYPSGAGQASPRQLFAMELETGRVVQLTNIDCFFITAQVMNATTVMALAACADTDGNGLINEQDKTELYLLDLAAGEMDCLTCDLDLTAINNPDYSPIQKKTVFSAQQNGVLHNYLFTIDAAGNLVQVTDDTNFMDFDCAWSQDGTRIVFSRLPLPAFTRPSQVWLMDSNGAWAEKITDGGLNTSSEANHGPYPVGTDADPDLSPDNSQIVFSRLKTGRQNEPFGVWELVIVDVGTRTETVLDSQYASMMPEWKSGGILFVRQESVDAFVSRPMEIRQSLYRYKDGQFTELEQYPYNVFPVGACGGSWIEYTED
ncbi:MAG: PD40 domain-containing protein [Dehalococcoidia bacterium]|nr:PD40 domain-containing protein [Dehalococcoidia bacterium]